MKREHFFKSNKKQKNNQQILFSEFLLIIGSIFLSEGIIAMLPSSLDKSSLAGLGFILVLGAILFIKIK